MSRASAIIFGIVTSLDASESGQPPPILQELDSAETLVTLWLSAHSLKICHFSKNDYVPLSRVPCPFYPGRLYSAEGRCEAEEAIAQGAC